MSTLLFIHGSGCTSDAFENQMRAFPQAHAPNLPGHASPSECKTVAEFADFIQRYIARHNLLDVVLCGNSLGGAIALEVALRESPEVRGIALLGSGSRLKVAPAILTGLAENFEQTAQTLAGYMFAQATPERTALAVQSMQTVGQAQTLRDFQACNAFDVTERLPELLVPLLAVTGEQDVMTPPKYAQSLADRVPAGEVRIVPGAGHLVMIERPAETNDTIADFVNRVR
ncbi:MAG: alpha/beta hydrolase [Candidatus Eremiobacteraeota bacterium]|nr:alpha/beta hydrolase [Candidatus Eremiobacteraeota bacterium]